MNRSPAVRLIALLVVLLASFWYIAFEVVGWRIGAQDYKIDVMLPRAGGIYTEADLTYRGVAVGRVTRLAIRPDGVIVTAEINPDVKIPADSDAQVRELSAAGEQYLNIIPRTSKPPWLHNGSVIPASRTTTPVPISQVLTDTSNLLNSINPKDLTTVTNALGSGFAGTSGDLRNIVVAGQSLIRSLEAAQPATVELITGANTVLKGAVATDQAFGQFATGLQQLTGQLKDSNSDINALLGNGVAAEQQTTQLLDQYSGSFVNLLQHAGTVSGVTAAEQPELQALFQVLPVFAGRIGAIVHGGSLHVELYFNTDDPVCSYVPASQVALPTAKTGAPSLDNTCATGDPPRGANTAP